MQSVKWLWLLVIPAVFLVKTHHAAGQEKPDYVSDKPEIAAEEETFGWSPLLKMSGTFAFTHSRNMVSVQDGVNINLGWILGSGLDYLHISGHQWSSTLDWQLNYLYTPTVDRFVKSLDELAFTTAYLYHIPKAKYLGPYVSFTLKTSIFKGYEVRTEDTAIRKVDTNGNLIKTSFVPAREEINLTTYFAPTTLRESLGFFGDLIDEKPVKLQIRGGVSAWEIFIRDGYRVGDDPDTSELDLVAMEDSVQLGGEFKAVVSGVIYKIVNYELKLEIMYPFVDNVDTDLSGIDLLNIEIVHSIGITITKWASLDYSFKAYHIPFIYPGWQLQNGLFITLTVGIL